MLLRSGRAVGMYNPYVRAGLITAAGLAAARAGLKKSRRWKKYTTNMLHRVGKPERAIANRNSVVGSGTGVNISTRVQYYNELTNIQKSNNQDIDKRNRDVIWLSGFKICMEVLNRLNTPLYFNYAVVYDKRANDGTVIMDDTDFFRGRGGTQRSTDFTNLLCGLDFRCLPLNTDRFSVFCHKRYMLNGDVNETVYDTNKGANYKTIEFYLPIKKKIVYEDGRCQSKLWEVYWCDQFSSATGATPVADAMFRNERITAYFRNIP